MVRLLSYLIIIVALFVLCSYLFLTINSLGDYFEDQNFDESTAFIIVGKDSGGKLSSGGRTDFIITMIKDENNDFKIISIPRDTIVKIKDKEHKINSVYLGYGIETFIDKVRELINVNRIAGYMVLDFETVIRITEFTGPVNVWVEKAMHHDDFQQDLHIHFEKGYHELKGEELLNYLRFRTDDDGDLGRIERQKDVMKKLVEKIMSLNIKKLYSTVKFIMDETENEFDFFPLMSLMYSFVTGNNGLVINTLPYRIDESGNVVPVNEAPSVDKKESPRILIINNIPNFSRYGNFSQIVKGQWKKRTGYDVLTCDKVPDLEIFEKRKTYVFVNNKDIELVKIFELAQPYHNADFLETYSFQGLGLYYRLIEWISRERIYPDYLDAVILLGVSQS